MAHISRAIRDQWSLVSQNMDILLIYSKYMLSAKSEL